MLIFSTEEASMGVLHPRQLQYFWNKKLQTHTEKTLQYSRKNTIFVVVASPLPSRGAVGLKRCPETGILL